MDNFLDFNKVCYPKRSNASLETILDWRVYDNPFFTTFDKDLFYYENEQIIGQIIPVFSRFVTPEESYDIAWGSDYIVADEYRGSQAGVKVLKTLIRKYIHFGVGMSETSLKMHQILREKEVSTRYDAMFIAGKKTPDQRFKLLPLDKFILKFSKEYKQNYQQVYYFERNESFYKWIFKFCNPKNVFVTCDDDSKSFMIFYKTKIKGVSVYKIIDYSPDLINDLNKFEMMINSFGQKSFKKIFFYSGSIDLSNMFKTFRNRTFTVYSNAERKSIVINPSIGFHVTGLDSDRFLTSFL